MWFKETVLARKTPSEGAHATEAGNKLMQYYTAYAMMFRFWSRLQQTNNDRPFTLAIKNPNGTDRDLSDRSRHIYDLGGFLFGIRRFPP